VIALDKPAGHSSFQVVKAVRKAYDVKRVGHTGTLDPFATGVLVVCVGRAATKLVPWLQRGDKEYFVEMVLGEETDTLDPEGEVVAVGEAVTVSVVDVQTILDGMVGTVMQAPPAYSALKVRGQRAYKLARKGEVPELAPRPVELHEAQVLAVEPGRVRARIRTGPGFYVRSLARDLAAALGTVGRLEALRRTETGGFREDEAVQIEALAGLPPLISTADALRGLKAVVLTPQQQDRVSVGLPPDGIVATGEVKLITADGALAAIANVVEGVIVLSRVFDTPRATG
jgi:tRNA pseudouridine55 synthase